MILESLFTMMVGISLVVPLQVATRRVRFVRSEDCGHGECDARREGLDENGELCMRRPKVRVNAASAKPARQPQRREGRVDTACAKSSSKPGARKPGVRKKQPRLSRRSRRRPQRRPLTARRWWLSIGPIGAIVVALALVKSGVTVADF